MRISDGSSDVCSSDLKSAVNADALMETFKARVPADQLGETFVINCPGTVTHWQLAVRARTHDLTVVPVYGHAETISVAEGLVFESGRPVLLLPEVTVPRSAEHTSELQSLMRNSYAVFCLKQKTNITQK